MVTWQVSFQLADERAKESIEDVFGEKYGKKHSKSCHKPNKPSPIIRGFQLGFPANSAASWWELLGT